MYATTGARFGKSEMVAGGLLLYAMRLTGKNPFVANISITLDQAKIVWDKAIDMATANRRFRHWFDPDNVKLTPFPTMRLHTGAEFWARSTMYECKYLRGYNFRAINYDEIAYGKSADLDVVKMRLADHGGPLGGTTTPRGRNFFWRECWSPGETEITQAALDNRQPKTFLMTGRSYDNPHIDHDYIREQRMSDTQRSQEVDGSFIDLTDKPISAVAVDAQTNTALNDEVGRWTRFMAGGARPTGSRFLHSWDLAKHGDHVVFTCWCVDRMPWQMVYWKRYQKKPWPVVEADISHMQKVFNADGIIDGTGVGDSTWDHLDVPTYRFEKFIFTNKSKTDVVEGLNRALESGHVEHPFEKGLIDELTDYEWDDADLSTDWVMSYAMAVEAMKKIAPPAFIV